MIIPLIKESIKIKKSWSQEEEKSCKPHAANKTDSEEEEEEEGPGDVGGSGSDSESSGGDKWESASGGECLYLPVPDNGYLHECIFII